MKLTSEAAMLIGGIISCAGQHGYEGKRKISDMIALEIADLHSRMKRVLGQDVVTEADEDWVAEQLTKCVELRKWKRFFEEAEG